MMFKRMKMIRRMSYYMLYQSRLAISDKCGDHSGNRLAPQELSSMKKLVLVILIVLSFAYRGAGMRSTEAVVIQLADTVTVPLDFKNELSRSFTKRTAGITLRFDDGAVAEAHYKLSAFDLADGKDKALATLAIVAAMSVVYFVGIPAPFLVTGAECRIDVGPDYNEGNRKYAGIAILYASAEKQWRRLGKKAGKKLARLHLRVNEKNQS